MTISMSRRIEIDSAHRVPHHDSKCRALHGHRYIIEAFCTGTLSCEGSNTGMLLDFSFLKQLLLDNIHLEYDHALILWREDPMIECFHKFVHEDWFKLVLTNEVPTAENLAKVWFEQLAPQVAAASAERVRLQRLVVHETPNCSASYSYPL